MPKLLVDGKEVDVPAHYTLLQAVEAAGGEVPRFCYHERLSVAGNCRMCLVELKGAPKPVASCAYNVRDCRPGPKGELPEVLTKSDTTRKAREGVMEFLLVNHPLDCPVCDRGGECDLQDQAMAYGADTSRFLENKRAIEDKWIGPLVETHMNRCIFCTRCVRFTAEIAGAADLGATGRGEDMEITTFLESAMRSEIQGNVIDLCPVGALNSRPYASKARPWELSKTESVDVMDALGSSIRVDARGKEVMRILPRVHEDVNEEWISDKTRFVFDGLKSQRLDRPFVRSAGRLRPATWPEAFAAIKLRLGAASPARIGAIVGDLAGVEETFALKLLMEGLGTPNLDGRQDGTMLHPRFGRGSYLFNATVAGIERADAILVVGSNPRVESPVLNIRIRKRSRIGRLPIGLVGEPAEMTFPFTHLGNGGQPLAELLAGRSPFAADWAKAKRPLVIVGQGALMRPDGLAVLAAAARLAAGSEVEEGWNGLSVLHTAAARVGSLDLGFVPGEGGLDAAAMARAGALDVLFNLGADEIEIAPGAFVVYQGSHGDRGAARADVILPAAAYTEKSATYVNTEGRAQLTNRAVFPPGEAKEDWAILRALSEALGRRLPFDSLAELRRRLYAAHPHLAEIDAVRPAGVPDLFGAAGEIGPGGFASPVTDFHLTNPIARASRTMAECSRLAAESLPLAAE